MSLCIYKFLLDIINNMYLTVCTFNIFKIVAQLVRIEVLTEMNSLQAFGTLFFWFFFGFRLARH